MDNSFNWDNQLGLNSKNKTKNKNLLSINKIIILNKQN